jgi:hypothetical protein
MAEQPRNLYKLDSNIRVNSNIKANSKIGLQNPIDFYIN